MAIGIKPVRQKFNIDINYKDALYDVNNLSGVNLSSINTKISIFSTPEYINFQIEVLLNIFL